VQVAQTLRQGVKQAQVVRAQQIPLFHIWVLLQKLNFKMQACFRNKDILLQSNANLEVSWLQLQILQHIKAHAQSLQMANTNIYSGRVQLKLLCAHKDLIARKRHPMMIGALYIQNNAITENNLTNLILVIVSPVEPFRIAGKTNS